MAEDTAKGHTEASELTRLQTAGARRAAEAAATMPSFTATIALTAVRDDGVLLQIVAQALRDCPAVNGAYRDGRIERSSRVNLGIALPGPVTPVLFDADQRGPATLAAEVAALRGRDPEDFTAPELSGATFTVTGLGLELASLAPLLTPRQAAGLGVGRERLTVVADARVLDAAAVADFLQRLA